ncbi:uncharacterized protein LOC108462012 [Gossypium arboreum]|uniref:uncharacterized protein LOC108462012 n=1 Tax=Gossypium arboreum TaxID=29729 RepID=UPI0008193B99|nr:uncharacterized protein LOC108462012 [Gossypium arboreum]
MAKPDGPVRVGAPVAPTRIQLYIGSTHSYVASTVSETLGISVESTTSKTELGEHQVLGPELVSETEDKILKRVGPVAYQLELPPELDHIHDVFHVSMLRQYQPDPFHVISVSKIQVKPDLTFKDEPVQILDRDFKVLRRKSILLVKVL